MDLVYVGVLLFILGLWFGYDWGIEVQRKRDLKRAWRDRDEREIHRDSEGI